MLINLSFLPQSLTTNMPNPTEDFPEVNYKTIMDNLHDRKKLLLSSGQGHGFEGTGSDPKGSESSRLLAKLTSVLNSEIACDECPRTFVDHLSLSKHKTLLHSPKTVSGHFRPNNQYECDVCKKTFAFAVNVKKHKWLAHIKPLSKLLMRQGESKGISALDTELGTNNLKAVSSLNFTVMVPFSIAKS